MCCSLRISSFLSEQFVSVSARLNAGIYELFSPSKPHFSDLSTGGQFLTRDIYGKGDTAKKIRQSMTSIQEAKAESTFTDDKAYAQAQAQGAAMCIARCVSNENSPSL